jgi:hypothetical protein
MLLLQIVKRNTTLQRGTQATTELSLPTCSSELNNLLEKSVHQNTGRARLSLDLLQQIFIIISTEQWLQSFSGGLMAVLRAR